MKVSKKLADLEEEVGSIKSLEKQLKDLKDLAAVVGENDLSLEEEVSQQLEKIAQQVKKEEIKGLLNGQYDSGNAIMTIEAGAGGREAEDWARMLLRMYQRYAERQNWEVKILSESFGEGGGLEGRSGINTVTLKIKGKYAYGYLKGESGVHRLIRISPFSEQGLRHTSFALVEVLPELDHHIQ